MIKRIFTLTPKQPSVKNGRDTPEICKSSFDFGSTAGRNNPKIRVPSIHFRSTSPERCVDSRPNTVTEALFDNNGLRNPSVDAETADLWMPGRAPKCQKPQCGAQNVYFLNKNNKMRVKNPPLVLFDGLLYVLSSAFTYLFVHVFAYIYSYIYTVFIHPTTPSLGRAPDEVLQSRKPRLGKSSQRL